MRAFASILLATFLAACSQSVTDAGRVETGLDASQSSTTCQDQEVTLDQDFDGAGFARCDVLGTRYFRLTIVPEDENVTNASPWYAFRLRGPVGSEIVVDLNYEQAGHRYQPKTTTDGSMWDYLPADQVSLPDEGDRGRARLRLEVGDSPLFVSAQEIFVPQTYDAWIADMAANPVVSRFHLGSSAEGRAIDGITIGSPDAAEQVILVGRQHPPEVTGALVMVPFLDTLMANTDLARRFRARFGVVAVPLLNPDGVVHGNWRHGTGGVDFNRDWGPFTQPETRLMRDLMEQIDADRGREMRLFIDFHSTRHDTVYTLTSEQVTNPPGLVEDWLGNYDDRLPDYEVRIDPGHNPDLPVSKAWVYMRFGIPTATFEIGDETDRELIQILGRNAAEAMMETLLELPAG